jgi:hypothetical protein
VANNISMVIIVGRILALMCSGYHIVILSPFPVFIPLLGSLLVLFLLETALFPFLVAYVFEILYLYICLIHNPYLEKHHFLS